MMSTTAVSEASPRKGTPAGELARRLMERVNAHDLDGLAQGQHPDVVDDFVAIGTYRGRDEIRRFFEELFTAFPDFNLRVVRLTSAGDTAVVEWEVDATFTGGPFQGVAANGKRVALRGVDCMTFEGELLRRNTIYYDGAAFARAVGLLPAMGSAAEKAMTTAFNAVTRVRQAIGR